MHIHNAFKHAFLLIAAIGLLSACETKNTTAIIAGVNPAAIQNGQHTVTKTVIANQTTNLGGTWEINPDCSVRGIATTRITQPPAHGTAVVAQREDYPNYPATNPRAACDKMKLPASFIDYTPAPGFTGSDILVFEIIGSNGTDNEYRIILTVK